MAVPQLLHGGCAPVPQPLLPIEHARWLYQLLYQHGEESEPSTFKCDGARRFSMMRSVVAESVAEFGMHSFSPLHQRRATIALVSAQGNSTNIHSGLWSAEASSGGSGQAVMPDRMEASR